MAAAKGLPISSYFESEELDYLPDTLLEKVSRKLPISDYVRIGTYLGVRMSDMTHLQCERNVLTQAREMFMVWYRKKHFPVWPELREALKESGRNDLIVLTHEFMRDHEMHDYLQAADNSEMWKVEKYFSNLASRVPADWKNIAIYLGLSMHEIATISQPVPSDRTLKNPVYEVLKAWKYNQTSPPHSLITVLDMDMGRQDVAHVCRRPMHGGSHTATSATCQPDTYHSGVINGARWTLAVVKQVVAA